MFSLIKVNTCLQNIKHKKAFDKTRDKNKNGLGRWTGHQSHCDGGLIFAFLLFFQTSQTPLLPPVCCSTLYLQKGALTFAVKETS